VSAAAGGFEFGEALEGGLGDFAEGVVSEEGLVAGDEDIGKGEEAGELVVFQDLRGAVLKEKAGFFLVDVDGEVADVALFEATDDGGGIKDGPPAGVDQEDTFFHLSEGVVID